MESTEQRCERLGAEIDWLVQGISTLRDLAEDRGEKQTVAEIDATMDEWKRIQTEYLAQTGDE